MQGSEEIARLAARSGLSLTADRVEIVAEAFADLWPGLEALNEIDVGAVEPAVVFRHDASARFDERA